MCACSRLCVGIERLSCVCGEAAASSEKPWNCAVRARWEIQDDLSFRIGTDRQHLLAPSQQACVGTAQQAGKDAALQHQPAQSRSQAQECIAACVCSQVQSGSDVGVTLMYMHPGTNKELDFLYGPSGDRKRYKRRRHERGTSGKGLATIGERENVRPGTFCTAGHAAGSVSMRWAV